MGSAIGKHCNSSSCSLAMQTPFFWTVTPPVFFLGKENGGCGFVPRSGTRGSRSLLLALLMLCERHGNDAVSLFLEAHDDHALRGGIASLAANGSAIRFASAPIIRCCAAVGGSAALRMRHTPCGCRSAHLVEVQPNFRLLPVSTMRRAQQCRIRQAVCRRGSVTRASR